MKKYFYGHIYFALLNWSTESSKFGQGFNNNEVNTMICRAFSAHVL